MDWTECGEHVAVLCEAHRIRVELHTTMRGFALIEPRRIQVRAVTGPVTYAAALHEIGHLVHPEGWSGDDAIAETAAWYWARQKALIWTPTMTRYAIGCLQSYGIRSA